MVSSVIYAVFAPTPPKPEIRYGEFPIKVVYEINGEQKTIEDTVICEYDGIGLGVSIGDGKHIKWKERLASGNERLTLLKIDENTEIYFPMGHAGYYLGGGNNYFMGDTADEEQDVWLKNQRTDAKRINKDEALEIYGIKIISWEPSEPIVNTFK